MRHNWPFCCNINFFISLGLLQRVLQHQDKAALSRTQRGQGLFALFPRPTKRSVYSSPCFYISCSHSKYFSNVCKLVHDILIHVLKTHVLFRILYFKCEVTGLSGRKKIIKKVYAVVVILNRIVIKFAFKVKI